MPLPSAYDEFFFPIARQFIEDNVNKVLGTLPEGISILDVGSQGKELERAFPAQTSIITLDIDAESKPDYIADICEQNADIIQQDSFDIVLLTDVLEHVCQPFDAINEVLRILKPEGLVIFSSPLNCRIHGPVPDCWRFTEFGLEVLFRNYDKQVFEKLESPDRNLFPLQYFGVWQKPKTPKHVKISDMKFKRIK